MRQRGHRYGNRGPGMLLTQSDETLDKEQRGTEQESRRSTLHSTPPFNALRERESSDIGPRCNTEFTCGAEPRGVWNGEM